MYVTTVIIQFCFYPYRVFMAYPKSQQISEFQLHWFKKKSWCKWQRKKNGNFLFAPTNSMEVHGSTGVMGFGKKMLWSVHCVQRKRPHSIHTSDPRMVAELRKTHFVRKVETINSPRWLEIMSDVNVIILLNLYSFIMQHMIQISPKKLSFARWTFRREDLRSTDKSNTIIILQVKDVRLSFTHRGELALLVFLITFSDNRKYFLIYF